eukprot:1271129-Amphidinium_carterae.1
MSFDTLSVWFNLLVDESKTNASTSVPGMHARMQSQWQVVSETLGRAQGVECSGQVTISLNQTASTAEVWH